MQPDTVHGSPEKLVDSGVTDGAKITGGWASDLAEACKGHSHELEIRAALDKTAREFDIQKFADAIHKELLHGAMLGALDSVWERTEGDIKPATFAAPQVGAPNPVHGFANTPFSEATKLFESRKVLPRPAFDALDGAAKRRAFTIARMASDELLATAHAELDRQLKASKERTYYDEASGTWVYKGPNLAEFHKFAAERLESAGWTPASPTHVETIYRTNVMGAYASGRYAEMRQPAVMAACPYWQVRGVGDDRSRATHKKAKGIILPATHEFWQRAWFPWGYNCRCGAVARTEAWVKRNGAAIGPVPEGLPDPGFESGVSMPVPEQTLQQPEAKKPPEQAPSPVKPQTPVKGPKPKKPKPTPPPSEVALPWPSHSLPRETLDPLAEFGPTTPLDTKTSFAAHTGDWPSTGKPASDAVMGAFKRMGYRERVANARVVSSASMDSQLSSIRANAVAMPDGTIGVRQSIAQQYESGMKKLASGSKVSAAESQSISAVFHEHLHQLSPVHQSAFTGPGALIEEAAVELQARATTTELTKFKFRTGPYNSQILDLSVQIELELGGSGTDAALEASRKMFTAGHNLRSPAEVVDAFVNELTPDTEKRARLVKAISKLKL